MIRIADLKSRLQSLSSVQSRVKTEQERTKDETHLCGVYVTRHTDVAHMLDALIGTLPDRKSNEPSFWL